LQERREARLPFRIVGGKIHEHVDTPHAIALLRAHCRWPRDCRTAKGVFSPEEVTILAAAFDDAWGRLEKSGARRNPFFLRACGCVQTD
jgi:hypothetical protein